MWEIVLPRSPAVVAVAAGQGCLGSDQLYYRLSEHPLLLCQVNLPSKVKKVPSRDLSFFSLSRWVSVLPVFIPTRSRCDSGLRIVGHLQSIGPWGQCPTGSQWEP